MAWFAMSISSIICIVGNGVLRVVRSGRCALGAVVASFPIGLCHNSLPPFTGSESMKSTIVAILLAVTGVHAFASSPKETLTSFHAALAAGDKLKVAELLSPEVTIYESGFVERSRAEYASHHLTDDIAFSKVTASKVLKQTERVEGNIAVLWTESETTGSFQGKDVHSLGTETTILEKKGDKWVVMHIHWSSRKAK